MVVLDPIKVILDTSPSESSISVPDFPFDPSRGNHCVSLSNILYIDRSDFRLVDDADYFGLAPNKSVSLKYASFSIRCNSYDLDTNGNVSTLHCSIDVSANKPKGSIQWVSALSSMTIEV